MPEIRNPLLRLFGVPIWVSAQSHIVFLAERPYQLLALMACRGGWSTRDELAELMWPQRSQASARGNLRTLLLRAMNISPEIVIEQQSDRLRWCPDSDFLRLEQAFADGRFSEVLALYCGPLMRGMERGLAGNAVDWLHFERDRIASVWRAAAAKELQAQAADPIGVAALAESVLAQDPGDEAAVAILARARAAQDRPVDGLRVLRAHAAWLASNFAVEPSATLRALDVELSDAARAAQSAQVPGKSQPQSQPPLTRSGSVTLVGRRLELLQIQALMQQPECRVLTITGLGGAGKSALARAAIPLLASQFSDGVFWVELDDLTQARQLPARIAQSLGVLLQGGENPWHDIAQQIALQSLMLVIDNSEHLADLAPHLGQLLEACPALRVLNTSRTRVGGAGEWLLPIDGLPVPDEDETDLEVLRRCDAVRLFEKRALAARPSFDLKAQAADAIALVRAVDGLPLAIELAATWVRLLPVRAIVEELAQSLDLLDQDAQFGRDGGLRACFAQSWRMLGDAERAALARLGLLPGAFGREMANQVAQCGLALLAALVDKSLLQADGNDRYALHPLVRQFAAEKAQEGACDPVAQRTRHLSFMTQWLTRISALGSGGKADDETKQALPHVRSAWQWALDRREPGLVRVAAGRLAQFYGSQGLLAEGRDAMQRAFSTFADGDATARLAAGWAAVAQASLWQRSGGFVRAEQLGRLAVEIAAPSRDTELQAMSLNAVGVAMGFAGQNEASLPLLERALMTARLNGHQLLEGIVLGNLARALKALGRYAQAAEMMAEALAIARAAQPPNHDGVVLQTNNLGNLHGATGRWTTALVFFQQALTECNARGATLYRPLVMMNLARAHLALGQIDDARVQALAALDLATALGRDLYALHVHLVLMRAAISEAKPDPARSALLSALDLADRLQLGAERVRCIAAYAELLILLGDRSGALALWRWARDQPGISADDTDHINRQIFAQQDDAAQALHADVAVPVSCAPAAVAAWVAAQCALASTSTASPKGAVKRW